MSDETNEKVTIFVTHGPDDPERATLPFVMANATLVMDVACTVVLQGNAVLLAKQGCAEHVFSAGLPPLRELFDSFFDQGGAMLVCSPCIKERKIEESMLVEKAEPIAGARAIQECLDSKAVLNY